MTKRLEGKVAMVTGAGSIGEGWGNGKATAVLFARDGARVFCIDRNQAAAQETCEIIRSEGGSAEAMMADVTNESQVSDAISSCVDQLGGLDVLHNNVGVLKAGGPEDTTVEDWDFVINVNLKAIFLPCKYALPQMLKANGGSIINMSSITGFRNLGAPYIAYNTSKGAIVSYTRNLAATYAAQGIRANCILPGMIDTPMAKDAAVQNAGGDADSIDFEEMAKQRCARIPMRRVGTGWDVANAAVFLASDAASYITGTELIVDGGLNCVA